MGWIRDKHIVDYMEGKTVEKVGRDPQTPNATRIWFTNGESLRICVHFDNGIKQDSILCTPFGADGGIKQGSS